jgi:hypothetical protein
MTTTVYWYDDVDLDEDPIDEDDWLDLGVVM